MVDWRIYDFEEVITEDGSPTLRDLRSSNLETMHHRGGAASETLYIYGNALQWGLQRQLRQVWSVGLGCGYNELLVADLSLKNSSWSPKLLSFEVREVLIQQFQKAILGNPEPFYQRVAESLKVNSRAFEELLKMESRGDRGVNGDFLQFPRNGACEILLFDAFSVKTDERLWSPEFLSELFSKGMSEKSLVATYACTGNLKRALKSSGFQLIPKSGFQGRRESTFAVRGLSFSS
ncbi:MAG: hypothetical protein LW875_07300 [Proteobacteria bacterium]|jgi:hypothetical protein|nr:hypothetical protein [Pseudomonadota bacterium]